MLELISLLGLLVLSIVLTPATVPYDAATQSLLSVIIIGPSLLFISVIVFRKRKFFQQRFATHMKRTDLIHVQGAGSGSSGATGTSHSAGNSMEMPLRGTSEV